MLNDKQLATTIVRTALSLTVSASGVSNTAPLAEQRAEPSCLGTGTIDLETGTEIGGPGDNVYASVANAMVGA